MIEIKVLGIGCPNCHKLKAMCHEVVNELGINARIKSLTDMNQFMNYGVLLTPALVINNEVRVQRKLTLKPTLVNWIRQGFK